MVKIDNLDANLKGYFLMVKVDNFCAYLMATLKYIS